MQDKIQSDNSQHTFRTSRTNSDAIFPSANLDKERYNELRKAPSYMPLESDLEPIAIIGIGCRLPGNANSPESFWKMLLEGTDAIREVTSDRWDVRAIYDPEQGKPGKTYSKWAGLIDEIDTFDPAFFGITQHEAAYVDPQQRLLLETTWEALMDAGQQVDIAGGEDTGVFIGISTRDYNDVQMVDPGRGMVDAYSATGTAASIAANRISYALNFQGPSFVVDTACSSSLVAVHLACRALWNKECSRAVAAGVNCIINAYPFVAFSSMSMLSPDGRCKAFDASANGFVRGEGAGAVCLKPLSAALAAGDPIYAVIRSTAVNQDGRTSGMTVPSRGSQQEIISQACKLAGIKPEQIRYAEAHGTGTAIGDLVEGSALGTILGTGRDLHDPCLIGSVKTNIGHLEAGSGIAGLIKLALCLKHRVVPPNLHFKTPNPSLNFERLRLKVPVEATPLSPDDEGRILACINSFGFGGTNAHAILEAVPSPTERAHSVSATPDQPWLLPLSARGSEAALTAVAKSFLSFLETADPTLSLPEIAAAAARRRTHHEFRLTTISRSREEAITSLTAFLHGEPASGLHTGQITKNARLVFVFSGQGSQWWGMGRELMEREPVFRSIIDACHVGWSALGGGSLLDELRRDEAGSRLSETHIAQVALFAIQVALATLWKSWGIRPAAVVGHSMGEVAAAHIAGALDLPSALLVIHHRGRCMEKTPLRGKMIAAALTVEEAQAEIAQYEGRVSLAAHNGPQLVSLSGDADAIDAILTSLEERKRYVRQIPVNYAFHSAHMEPVKAELADALKGLHPVKTEVKIYSTVTGRQAEGTDYDASYWWKNVRQGVLFAPAIESLITAGHTHFLEISPHPVLSTSISESLTASESMGLVLSSLRRQKPEHETLLDTLAELYVNGHDAHWTALYPHDGSAVRLPSYPWQKERYWNEPTTSLRLRLKPELNHLLNLRVPCVHPTWETPLNKSVLTWLKDHRVGQHLIFPGAGYVAMALGAARVLHAGAPCLVEELEIHNGCILPAGEDVPVLQIACTPVENSFVIQSSQPVDPPVWTGLVSGRLRTEPERGSAPCFDLEALRRRCPQDLDGEIVYQTASSAGLHYGPRFRGLKHVWLGEEEALGRIEVPAAVADEFDHHEIHPALLDACFHPAIALPADGLYLPARLERIRLHAKPSMGVWSYVKHTRTVAGKIITLDVFILDDAGQALLEIRDFQLKHAAMNAAPGSGAQSDWLYEPRWYLKPLEAAATRRSPADYLPDNAALATRLRHEAAAHRDELGLNRRYEQWESRFEQLCLGYILNAFKQLRYRFKRGSILDIPSLMRQLKLPSGQERLLKRLLHWLAQGEVIEPQSSAEGEPTWKVLNHPPSIPCDKLWREMVFHFPSFHPELILLDRCASGLAKQLRRKQSAEHLPSTTMLEHFQASSVFTRTCNHLVAETIRAAIAARPEGRPLKVLEIGAGTGGITASVLPLLPPTVTRYLFTNVTDAFFEQASQKFADYDFLSCQLLDLSKPHEDQGIAIGSQDIILLSNALSLAADVRQALRQVQQMLAPGGLLLLLETDRPCAWHDLVLGTNQRWWHGHDPLLRPDHPLLPAEKWQSLLSEAGFTSLETVADTEHHARTGQALILGRNPLTTEIQKPQIAPPTSDARRWLIFADSRGVAARLATKLHQHGYACTLVKAADHFAFTSADEAQVRPDSTEDYQKLFTASASHPTPLQGVVHLWSLDTPEGWDISTEKVADSQTLVCHSPLLLVQAMRSSNLPTLPCVTLITRGAQAAGDQIEGICMARSALPGLARVIMNEMPELRCRAIDLDFKPSASDADILLSELLHTDGEDETAWRGEARYALRLTRVSLDVLAKSPPSPLQSDQCFRLETAKPGALDQLVFRSKQRRAPGPDEVEIEVHAAGVNFRDVMKALGIYPAEAEDAMLLGDECAGVITRVGSNVKDLKPGTAVMALAAGCFSSHVTTFAHAVIPRPDHLSMEEAATMMVAYLTAYYSLMHQGRMARKERVLIHAGTGGVGQAAVRLSQALGAEIFSTAGTPEKRAFLKKIGVPHVLDSRTLSFASEIMSITAGEGIDLVLNSLAGEAIHQSLSVLRQYGRFLEIGKRDIYGNTKVGLFPFRKNLSYHAIDLGHALAPQNAKPILRSLRRLIDAKKLPSLPSRVFTLADATHAFRYITQARQIGKIVLSVKGTQPALTPAPPAITIQFKSDAAYLIAGGLGGFGMALAHWLVKNGARHLILASRSGASTTEALAGVSKLQDAGAKVSVLQADITRPAEVAAMLAAAGTAHPPLRGIFHTAMVLDDDFIPRLTPERFRKVTTPKINGAWNLHQQTQGLPIDHFVLFSSVSSLVGSPGQANYAAANAFLDALATHRHARGLPALAINWGVMAGVGYVARNKKLEEHFERIGWAGLKPEQSLPVLGRLLNNPHISQMMVSHIDWAAWATSAPKLVATPRYALLTTEEALHKEQSDDINWLREKVLNAAPQDQIQILETFLRGQTAKVLRVTPAKLDLHRPLNEIGIDSLMAVELIHQIESRTGLIIPTAQLLNGAPSISKLAELLFANITGREVETVSAGGMLAASTPAAATGE